MDEDDGHAPGHGIKDMIRARDAIRTAQSLLGTPYSEMDCMAMIVRVIRSSPGGESDYRCQGTNWLWKSAENSEKYRHLTWKQEGLAGVKAGMLAFKKYAEDDVGHVGLVADGGMVIHSSSEGGRGVVMTPLTAGQGWDLIGIHRCIEPEETQRKIRMENISAYQVITRTDPLSLRDAPKTGRIIARMPAGTIVQAAGDGEWLSVKYEGMRGYASAKYLQRMEEGDTGRMRLVLTDEAGNTWIPEGGFSAEMRKMED